MKFEWNRKNIILITVLTILVIISSLLYNYRNSSDSESSTNKLTLVSDYSRFFTISNCVNTYVGYLSNKDSTSLLKLLDSDYITDNSITSSNVLDKLDNLGDGIYTFDARKIYQKKVSDNVVKYYVYGYLKEQIMDDYTEPSDYYVIVNLNTSTFIFSITPYNGAVFKEDE